MARTSREWKQIFAVVQSMSDAESNGVYVLRIIGEGVGEGNLYIFASPAQNFCH